MEDILIKLLQTSSKSNEIKDKFKVEYVELKDDLEQIKLNLRKLVVNIKVL